MRSKEDIINLQSLKIIYLSNPVRYRINVMIFTNQVKKKQRR